MRLSSVIPLVALMPTLLSAQAALGGGVRFDLPTGWHREQTTGGTYLVPDAVPNGQVVIFLGVRPLTGGFQDGYQKDLAGLSQGFKLLTRTALTPSKSVDGVALLSSQAHLQGQNGGHSYRYYLAANPPGELHMAVYMAATEQLYQAHCGAMQQFASGWRFDGNPPAPTGSPPGNVDSGAPVQASRPPPLANPQQVVPAGRLEGMYTGYKYIYVTVLGVVQKQAALDHYTFFADGTVYWGIVPMLGFNMAQARQQDPEYTGTYSVSGHTVSVSLGPSNRFVAVLSGNLLRIEDREFTLEGDPGKTADRVLDGVFRRADAQPGEDLARRSIRFTRDGSFADQGIIESITASEIVNGNPVPQRAAGQGRYQLARNTLLLRYSDGYEQRLPITISLAEQTQGSPAKISVNTYDLVRK